ncbi:unnamed protein product, partial [Prorocentrum cordatum]
AKIVARWPRAAPCHRQPLKNALGRIIFKCCEAPGIRWTYVDDNNGGGRWGWLCDECGKAVNDQQHFTSTKHMKQRRQTQLARYMEGETPHGLPDSQRFMMGGDLWSMTEGKATPDIPRVQCPGLCWDWDLDGVKSPIDPCVYKPDWDWISIGFPGCYDGPEYSPPLGLVINDDNARLPWTKAASPKEQTKEQELRDAGQALAGAPVIEEWHTQLAKNVESIYSAPWYVVKSSAASRPCLGPVPGAVPPQSDWIRRLQTYGKELKSVFFTEFYADVEASPASPLESIAKISWIHINYRIDSEASDRDTANTTCSWDKMWAMEWTERGMTSGTPNPIMVSKTLPTVDFLAVMTPVWPPAPGARVSGTDRSCPFGMALVRYDAKKRGPFHDSDATVRRPPPGQPYYRVDRATRMAQFKKVNAAIREFFSAGCERAALWGTALPPIVWALVFRREGRDRKASALSVPAQGVAADRLLAQASATLERVIDDPDQPGASRRVVEPPLTLQQADESPAPSFSDCCLSRGRITFSAPATSETKVAACIADACMSRLAPEWGVGCFGGSVGSMGALAEQIGKNLTPDCSDLFPRLAARLVREGKVKGNAAREITPVAKCAEAKLTLAPHEAGADLWDKKFLLCLLGEAGQTTEPMAIVSLIH